MEVERGKRVRIGGGGGGGWGGILGADKVAGATASTCQKVQDLCVLLVLKETCKTRSPNL